MIIEFGAIIRMSCRMFEIYSKHLAVLETNQQPNSQLTDFSSRQIDILPTQPANERLHL